MHEAITNFKKVSFTTMDQIRSAKKSLKHQRDRFVNEYNEFMTKLIEILKNEKTIAATDTVFGYSDVDTAYYLQHII